MCPLRHTYRIRRHLAEHNSQCSQTVVGQVPVCVLIGACEGQAGENPGCFKLVPLELEGEEGRDKRAKITRGKKALQEETDKRFTHATVRVNIKPI